MKSRRPDSLCRSRRPRPGLSWERAVWGVGLPQEAWVRAHLTRKSPRIRREVSEDEGRRRHSGGEAVEARWLIRSGPRGEFGIPASWDCLHSDACCSGPASLALCRTWNLAQDNRGPKASRTLFPRTEPSTETAPVGASKGPGEQGLTSCFSSCYKPAFPSSLHRVPSQEPAFSSFSLMLLTRRICLSQCSWGHEKCRSVWALSRRLMSPLLWGSRWKEANTFIWHLYSPGGGGV